MQQKNEKEHRKGQLQIRAKQHAERAEQAAHLFGVLALQNLGYRQNNISFHLKMRQIPLPKNKPG
jgi:Holliday junction resolvasome RuvABC DNA-binding subunit